jgi:hypothetical protein
VSDTAILRPWQQTEIVLTANEYHHSPYTAVDVWGDFTDSDGQTLRRPAFFDGGSTWRLRFAAPAAGRWTWSSSASVADPGLAQQGEIRVSDAPTDPSDAGHRFLAHGFWRMSADGRSLVHADGKPALLIGDTAWALPWRATPEQVKIYAKDRHAKGFNAVLLMTVQPDMRATGPRDRAADGGFDVGFEDLPDGHLNDLLPGYFQYLDGLIEILRQYGIVPVLQPVFFGFGWKGLDVAGPVIPPAEYARYCRYLVARYGAGPVVYLVGADGSGSEPQLPAGGAEFEAWDAYRQPTGLHYRPHATNAEHQAADWLDFQWCQTGHTGEHAAERVADMWRNVPAKAVANGEPTYEGTRVPEMGAGWWQGDEAWSNLCAGGTMGVVYGAASLWQWVLRPDEPGQMPFYLAPGVGWREALDFPGSTYVGMLGKILDGLPLTGMMPGWQHVLAARCLIVPGKLFINYSSNGGPLVIISDDPVPLDYRVIDPRSGRLVTQGRRAHDRDVIQDPGGEPRVYICYDGR